MLAAMIRSFTSFLNKAVSPPKILIVEDDGIYAGLVFNCLRKFDCTIAKSGEEALSIYSRAPSAWRSVLCDMGLPGMPGNILVRAIRAINPQQHVVVLTGYPEMTAEFDSEIPLFKPNTILTKACDYSDIRHSIAPTLTPEEQTSYVRRIVGTNAEAHPVLYGRAA